ncbi:MAG: hypothetical protein NTW45_07055 [Rhodocyclales bacterium]|nr:hypothetical protein [Rhodocyclales bacterium]
MYFVFGFRVADRHNGHTQKAGGVESLLAVVFTSIFHGEGWPVENFLGIREIKAVLFQVGRALDGFPRKVYVIDYIYEYIYCKACDNQ